MSSRERKKDKGIPTGVVTRLPIYLRYLTTLRNKGVSRVSSAQLGEALNFTAAQIRSDLSYFGSFGQQGYGYDVNELLHHVSRILGLDRTYAMVLVGAGNLGKALASYENFRKRGFEIRAIFDIDEHLVGNYHACCIIQHVDNLENYLKEHPTDIGIIATPGDVSQSICDIFVRCGVRSIWNFSPVHLHVPEDVIIEHMHLTDSLLRLSFRLNERGQRD